MFLNDWIHILLVEEIPSNPYRFHSRHKMPEAMAYWIRDNPTTSKPICSLIQSKDENIEADGGCDRAVPYLTRDPGRGSEIISDSYVGRFMGRVP